MASRQFFILLQLLAGVFVCSMEQAEAAGKPVTTARKEDVPFIKCRVCEAIAKQLIRQVNRERERIAPKKLVEQPMEGVCKTDCKTIERACQEVMGEYDTDVAEYLFKVGSNRAGLLKLLCRDLSQACVGQPTRLPKDRGPGEAFTPKVGKQAEVDKLMRTLKNDAPGLTYYSREDIQNNPGIAYSGGRSPRDPDDDDDDDDEDNGEDYDEGEDDAGEGKIKPGSKTWGDNLAALSGNVAKLRAKAGSQTQRAIQNASKRASKATRRISRWWFGKTKYSTSRSKRKSSSNAASEEL